MFACPAVSIIYDYFHAVILFYGFRTQLVMPGGCRLCSAKNGKARRVCTRQALLVRAFYL